MVVIRLQLFDSTKQELVSKSLIVGVAVSSIFSKSFGLAIRSAKEKLEHILMILKQMSLISMLDRFRLMIELNSGKLSLLSSCGTDCSASLLVSGLFFMHCL